MGMNRYEIMRGSELGLTAPWVMFDRLCQKTVLEGITKKELIPIVKEWNKYSRKITKYQIRRAADERAYKQRKNRMSLVINEPKTWYERTIEKLNRLNRQDKKENRAGLKLVG